VCAGQTPLLKLEVRHFTKNETATFAAGGWQGFLRDMTAQGPDGFSRYMAAICFVQLSDKDKAFAELNNAFESRDTRFDFLRLIRALIFLRDDPRFQELLRCMRFPEVTEIE